MKKLLYTLPIICALALSSWASVKISSVRGTASVMRGQQWVNAVPGMELAEKDAVKTPPDGRVSLVVNDATVVWVTRNSQLEVSSLDKGSVFSIVMGKLRAKVRNLQGGKFQIKTPVSVASVRGTDFSVDASGVLSVFEGNVDFSGLDLTQIVAVVAGQINAANPSGNPGDSRAMTPEELAAAEQEWLGFDGDQGSHGHEQSGQKQDAKKDLDKMRSELRAIVSNIKNDINTTRETTNEVKEADLSAGRTLRDIHGNIVRVEQQLLRPDASSIQIVNLTKRSDYTYTDRQGWVRTWGEIMPNTSRLDVASVHVSMNMNLPEQITEWPSFIQSKGDDLHPQAVIMKMTNQHDSIENIGAWKLKGQIDNKGEVMRDDGMVFDSYVNGWKVDAVYDDSLRQADPGAVNKNGTDKNGSANDELWITAISPDMKVDKDGQTKYLRLYTESYVINNSGSLMRLNDITNSSENPFRFFKTLASEEIIFAREIDRAAGGREKQFFTHGNLDLVITPDIVIAVAEKLASQAGNMQGSDNKDSTGNNP